MKKNNRFRIYFEFLFKVAVTSFLLRFIGYKSLVGFRALGDTCYEMMYIDEYIRKTHKKIRIIVSKKKKTYFLFYPQISKVSYISDCLDFLISKGNFLSIGRFRCLGLLFTLHWRFEDFQMPDRIKCIYNLDINSKYRITYPRVKVKHVKIPLKCIFLNTQSYYYKSRVISDFLLEVGKKVAAEGFVVFYNSEKKYDYQNEWVSTSSFSLAEIYSISLIIKIIISIRTGLLDFIVNTNSRIFCLYDQSPIGQYLQKHFSLEKWESNSRIEEFVVEELDVNSFVERIIKQSM